MSRSHCHHVPIRPALPHTLRRFVCALNIVAKWEECIRSQCHIGIFIQPCTLLFCGKYRRFYLKNLLPCTICKDIHIILTHVQINGIVTVRTLDTVNKLAVLKPVETGAATSYLPSNQPDGYNGYGTAVLLRYRLPVRP